MMPKKIKRIHTKITHSLSKKQEEIDKLNEKREKNKKNKK